MNEPDRGGAPTIRDPLHDDERPGLVLPEEDGLFARDIDGQLVRMDKVTAADFDRPPGTYAHQLRGVFTAGYRDTLAKGTVMIEHSPL